MIKHPDLSLLPIDVGVDVRRQCIVVTMPSGDHLMVDYMSRRNVARRVEGDRALVIHALQAAGYRIAEGSSP